MRFAVVVLFYLTTPRRSVSASFVIESPSLYKLDQRRLQLSPTPAPTVFRCPDEEDALFLCFANNGITTNEEAMQCIDCFIANYPEESTPTCDEFEQANCESELVCPCGGCGPLITAINECLNEEFCPPFICPTPAPTFVVAPTPSPIGGTTPSPIGGSTPSPIGGSTPSPIGGSTPSPIVDSTLAPTVFPCPDEEDALINCFATNGITTNEEAMQCVDCFSANSPEEPTCDELEQANCESELVCPCGGCGPLITAINECLNEGFCPPFICPTPAPTFVVAPTPSPLGGTTPAPTSQCTDEEDALLNCFVTAGINTEEEATQCIDCFIANTPDDFTCDELEVASCLSEQECSCGGCGSLITDIYECYNEGVCPPIVCPVPSPASQPSTSPPIPAPTPTFTPGLPTPTIVPPTSVFPPTTTSDGGTLPIWLSSVSTFFGLLGAIL